jgi:hypothetical protein
MARSMASPVTTVGCSGGQEVNFFRGVSGGGQAGFPPDKKKKHSFDDSLAKMAVQFPSRVVPGYLQAATDMPKS